MVEDDTFTYHVKQQSAGQINKTTAQSLITKERTQKLDLLIHLLSNLAQALVVCGPEGIGKTTLLKILQERKTESWHYCLMQGNAFISFEAVQEQLVKVQSAQSLSTAPGRHAGQYKQTILIIDNAGELVPGLIAAIIQYAAANPALRVIFALTHDELQVKRGSDRAIDNCHIVEIPSLSEKQCGDFLQHLSTLSYANLSFKAINDNMIAHIYRETHGVPGRIIAEVSGGFSGGAKKKGGKLKWILAFAGATAVAIALGVQWLMSSAVAPGIALSPVSTQSSKSDDKQAVASVAVEHNEDNIKAESPQPESRIMLTLPPAPAQPVTPQQSLPAKDESKTIEPSGDGNVDNKNDRQMVIPSAKPEASNAAVDKQPANIELHPLMTPAPIQVTALPVTPEGAQEKPKPPELNKTVNVVTPPAVQNPGTKTQTEQVNKADTGQKPNKKQLEVAQQKTADQLWAAREKLKQEEMNKAVNSIEPLAPNKLETIQIPQKPVEIAAIPEGQVPGTVVPQKVEAEVLPLVETAGNFTLQLMVLSKQSSADDMVRKYPAFEPDIRVIRTIAKGKEKFILEYGSYPDAISANKAKESLPFEFRRALVRKK